MDSTSETDKNESPKRQDVLGLLQSFHSFESGDKDLAILVLITLDREPTINSLLKILKDGDVNMRCDAVEALMRIDSKVGTKAILPLLGDSDADVRWHACGLLYDFGDEQATQQLTEVLLNDTEGYVRYIAANALGKVGDLSAVPSLRHAAQFDEGQELAEDRRVCDAANEAIESILARYPKRNLQ